MAAPKLRTPTDATITAPASCDALRRSMDHFLAGCRQREAAYQRAEANRAAALAELGPSPAFAAAEAAFTEHAGRWAGARLETMAATGCTDTPARDRFPFRKGFPS